MYFQNFAQKLVNADRASLFLLDTKTKELYARIFDVGTNASEHQKLDEDGAKDLRWENIKFLTYQEISTDAYEILLIYKNPSIFL